MKEAAFYDRLDKNRVQCRLCPHFCILNPGCTGICGVRKNISGCLYSLNYHKVVAINADPIEKKPLYHCLPGTLSFSISTMGCNFRCSFCQNHSISVVASEKDISGHAISPKKIVSMAIEQQCDSIAYTYTEPTVFFELMLDTAQIAREHGLKNVMVSNGFISRAALEALAPWMDAANVDLKAFNSEFYSTRCRGELNPVLETIVRMKELNIWLEITTLLITGLNTDKQENFQLIDFIKKTDPSIPWHVSRYFPNYKLDVPPTAEEEIRNLLQEARLRGLEFVYGGNMTDRSWSDTLCPDCDTLLIERRGYFTRTGNLKNGICGQCSKKIAGIWE